MSTGIFISQTIVAKTAVEAKQSAKNGCTDTLRVSRVRLSEPTRIYWGTWWNPRTWRRSYAWRAHVCYQVVQLPLSPEPPGYVPPEPTGEIVCEP